MIKILKNFLILSIKLIILIDIFIIISAQKASFLSSNNTVNQLTAIKTDTNLLNLRKLTISFFFKAVEFQEKSSKVVCFNNCQDNSLSSNNVYLSLEALNNNIRFLSFSINNNEYFNLSDKTLKKVFKDTEIKESVFINRWVYLSLSVYKSLDNTVKPHIVALQVDRYMIPPINNNNNNNTLFLEGIEPIISGFFIHYETKSLFARLSIYNTFIYGTYGVQIGNFNTISNTYLLQRIELAKGLEFQSVFSSTVDNSQLCIDIKNIDTNITNMRYIECEEDDLKSQQQENKENIFSVYFNRENYCVGNNNNQNKYFLEVLNYYTNNNIIKNNINNNKINDYECNECSKSCNNHIVKDLSFLYSCFGETKSECSCINQRFDYYLKQNGECLEAENYNLAYFEDIQLKGLNILKYNINNFKSNDIVDSVTNLLLQPDIYTEFTVEFWLNLNLHNNDNYQSFNKYEIIYDGHLKIDIAISKDNFVDVTCYPYAKTNDDNAHKDVYYKNNNDLEQSQWYLIRCAVSRNINHEFYYVYSYYSNKLNNSNSNDNNLKIPNNIEQKIDNTLYDYKAYLTENREEDFLDLLIKYSSNSNNNFKSKLGYIFIRELRIYSVYLFPFMDTRNISFSLKEYLNKNSNMFSSINYNDRNILVNYYKFDVNNSEENNVNNIKDSQSHLFSINSTPNKNIKQVVYDIVNNMQYVLTSLSLENIDGYGILNSNYTNLNYRLCGHMKYFDYKDNICKSIVSNTSNQSCFINSDDKKTCLVCNKETPYLHVDNQCYSNCPEGYYNNDNFNMCKVCNINCKKCNGGSYNDCISCKEGSIFNINKNNKGACYCGAINKIKNIRNKSNSSSNQKNINNQTCINANLYSLDNNINNRKQDENIDSNLAEYDDIVIQGISNSLRYGRYTLSSWIFIENINELKTNIDIIYTDHILLELKQIDENNNSYLKITCFPRDYITKKINIDKIQKSNSSYFYSITYKTEDINSKWLLIVCSVSLLEGYYYLNNSNKINFKPIQDLSQEVTNKNSVLSSDNLSYYKDNISDLDSLIDNNYNYNLESYDINKSIDNNYFVLRNCSKSNSRIYVNKAYIFEEYINFELIKHNMFYKDISKYKLFSPLIFSLNIPIVLNSELKDNNAIGYYKIKSIDNKSNNFTYSNEYYRNTKKKNNNITSDNSKVYDINLCNSNQEINNVYNIDNDNAIGNFIFEYYYSCNNIIDNIKNEYYKCDVDSNNFCLKSDYISFYCNNNTYLNNETFKCIKREELTDIDMIKGLSSNSNSNSRLTEEGYLHINCTKQKNYSNCKNIYYINKEAECVNNSVKVFNDCVDKDIYRNNNNYLYFSGFTGFNDIYKNLNFAKRNINEYVIEVWFKIDTSEFGLNSNNINYFTDNQNISDNKAINEQIYLILTPHVIKSKTFIEDNNKINLDLVYVNLNSDKTSNEFSLLKNNKDIINVYEWINIHIVVENNNNNNNSTNDNTFIAKIYLNLDFNSKPVIQHEFKINDNNADYNILCFTNNLFKKERFCGIEEKTTSELYINNIKNKYIKWGTGWYKSIKIWSYTKGLDLSFIQEEYFMFNNKSKYILHLYEFQLNSLDVSSVPYKINDNSILSNNNDDNYSLNIELLNNTSFYYDKAINYTFEVDYIDKFGKEGEYVVSINNETNKCIDNCKRCFNDNFCYKCDKGYIINKERKCIKIELLYLSIPNKDKQIIKLNTKNLFSNINNNNNNKYTIYFYIKIKSVEPSFIDVVNNKKHYKLIMFNDNLIYNYLSVSLNDNNSSSIALSYVINDNNNKDSSNDSTIMSYNIDTLFNKWMLISLSINISLDTTLYYNMFNMQINDNMVKLYKEVFNNFINKDLTNFYNSIYLSNEVIFNIYNLSILNKYIHGPYGFIKGDINKINKYIIQSFYFTSLASSDYSKCLDVKLDVDNSFLKNTNISQDSIKCTNDEYNIFLDYNLNCNEELIDKEKYILSFNEDYTNYECKLCNDNCNTTNKLNKSNEISDSSISLLANSCYKNGEYVDNNNNNSTLSYCSCIINKFSNFIINNECSIVDNLNFAYLENIEFNVKRSFNNEYTLEFWMYIGSYINIDNFNSIDIIWDAHLRISVINYKSKSSNKNNKSNIIATCYPYVEVKYNNIDKYYDYYKQEYINDNNTNSFEIDKWSYFRCAVYRRINNVKKLPSFYLNKNQEELMHDYSTLYKFNTYLKQEYSDSNTVVFNIINNNNPNFGFVYIRELKLYSVYFNQSIDTSRTNLVSNSKSNIYNNIEYLLHYFKGDNILYDFNKDIDNIEKNYKIYMIDYSNNKIKSNDHFYSVILKDIDYINGYNYYFNNLSSYNNLVICEYGYYYDIDSNKCLIDTSSFCTISYNGKDGCILCNENNNKLRLLNNEGKCVDKCDKGEYADNTINMCRKCYQNCDICNGPNESDCAICPIDKYSFYNVNTKETSCIDDCNNIDNKNYEVNDKYNIVNYEDKSSIKECAISRLTANIRMINIDNYDSLIDEINNIKSYNKYDLSNIFFEIENVNKYIDFLNPNKSENNITIENYKDFYIEIELNYNKTNKYNNITNDNIIPQEEIFKLLNKESDASYSIIYDTELIVNGYGYFLNIILTDKLNEKVKHISEKFVKFSTGPFNGIFSINPKEGIESLTDFKIMCLNFTSGNDDIIDNNNNNNDLIYQLYYYKNINNSNIINLNYTSTFTENKGGYYTIKQFEFDNYLTSFNYNNTINIGCKIKYNNKRNNLTTVFEESVAIYHITDYFDNKLNNSNISDIDNNTDTENLKMKDMLNYLLNNNTKEITYNYELYDNNNLNSTSLLAYLLSVYLNNNNNLDKTIKKSTVYYNNNEYITKDEYCSNFNCMNENGMCLMVDNYQTCRCNKTHMGYHCNIKSENYNYLYVLYNDIINKLLYNKTNVNNKDKDLISDDNKNNINISNNTINLNTNNLSNKEILNNLLLISYGSLNFLNLDDGKLIYKLNDVLDRLINTSVSNKDYSFLNNNYKYILSIYDNILNFCISNYLKIKVNKIYESIFVSSKFNNNKIDKINVYEAKTKNKNITQSDIDNLSNITNIDVNNNTNNTNSTNNNINNNNDLKSNDNKSQYLIEKNNTKPKNIKIQSQSIYLTEEQSILKEFKINLFNLKSLIKPIEDFRIKQIKALSIYARKKISEFIKLLTPIISNSKRNIQENNNYKFKYIIDYSSLNDVNQMNLNDFINNNYSTKQYNKISYYSNLIINILLQQNMNDNIIYFKSLKYNNVNIKVIDNKEYLVNNNISLVSDYDNNYNYPYISIKNCLLDTYKNNQINSLSSIALSIIIYENTIYFSDPVFNNNNLSYSLDIKLINLEKGEYVNINSNNIIQQSTNNNKELNIPCNSQNNKIKLYFPVTNVYIPSLLNHWSNYIDPQNMNKNSIDDYYADPYIIKSSGEVIDLSLKDRIRSYVPFNINCNYLDKNNEFSSVGLKYNGVTKNGYIECLSNHLTEFSVDYSLKDTAIKNKEKLFYAGYFQLYIWRGNYTVNYGLYYFLLILLIFIINKIFYCIYSRRKYAHLYTDNNEDIIINKPKIIKIVTSIIRSNLPYLSNYNFNILDYKKDKNNVYNNNNVYKSNIILGNKIKNNITNSYHIKNVKLENNATQEFIYNLNNNKANKMKTSSKKELLSLEDKVNRSSFNKIQSNNLINNKDLNINKNINNDNNYFVNEMPELSNNNNKIRNLYSNNTNKENSIINQRKESRLNLYPVGIPVSNNFDNNNNNNNINSNKEPKRKSTKNTNNNSNINDYDFKHIFEDYDKDEFNKKNIEVFKNKNSSNKMLILNKHIESNDINNSKIDHMSKSSSKRNSNKYSTYASINNFLNTNSNKSSANNLNKRINRLSFNNVNNLSNTNKQSSFSNRSVNSSFDEENNYNNKMMSNKSLAFRNKSKFNKNNFSIKEENSDNSNYNNNIIDNNKQINNNLNNQIIHNLSNIHSNKVNNLIYNNKFSDESLYDKELIELSKTVYFKSMLDDYRHYTELSGCSLLKRCFINRNFIITALLRFDIRFGQNLRLINAITYFSLIALGCVLFIASADDFYIV